MCSEKDKNTEKVLGVVCLGSDVVSIGVRDKHIGWTKGNKLDDGKLRHTSIATTIEEDPNILAASVINFEFFTAAVLMTILSAPALSNPLIFFKDLIPPPTVKGIKTVLIYK